MVLHLKVASQSSQIIILFGIHSSRKFRIFFFKTLKQKEESWKMEITSRVILLLGCIRGSLSSRAVM